MSSQSDARPVWEVRRERVDESARAILAVLQASAGEWVPMWRTLLDAQLRDEHGLVDVALGESIDAIQHRLGVRVQRTSMSDGLFYRVLS